MGVQTGVLQRAGTWLTYGEVKLGQGRENARHFLKENPNLFSELESKVRESAAPATAAPAVSAAANR